MKKSYIKRIGALLISALLSIPVFSETEAYFIDFTDSEQNATLTTTKGDFGTTVPSWATGVVAYYLTSGSSGSITIPGVELNAGGRVEVTWGSASGRPLIGYVGSTQFINRKSLVSAERSTVLTESYDIPDSIEGSQDIKLMSSGGGSVYFFSVTIYTNDKGASISSISFKGKKATISGSSVTLDLSGVIATDGTVDLTSEASYTLSEGATIKFYSDEECTSEISSATANTKFYAYVADETTAKLYSVTISSSVKTPVITLTSGNNAQSVKSGKTISDITYSIDYASSVSCTGLPDGISFNSSTYTISGTPSTSDYKEYTYELIAKGAAGAEPEADTVTGTIKVIDPSAKVVAYIYTSTTAPTGNNVYDILNANYAVTVVDGTASLSGTAADQADLIVLDESVSSSATGAKELGALIGTKPILNLKAHMYGKTNWPTGTGNNDNGSSATVASNFTTHPIFSGITLTDNAITIADAIRSVSSPAAKSGTLREIATSTGGVSIIEENNGTATDAAKYMMISISSASESALTEEGKTLFTNAANYLLGSDVFVPAASTEATMTAFSIDGINGTIDEANKTVNITLASELYPDLTALTPNVTVSNNATVSPASATATDFSTGSVNYVVTAEDGTTTATYAVTVSTESVAITAPYSTTIPADFTLPKGIMGNATVETAYEKTDAKLWYEDGETTTASVIRFGKGEKLTIVVNNPGTVTIGMSATGGRTFNLYVDDNTTPVATVSAKSNTAYELTSDVYLTGTHKIIIENAGTSGDATIGTIDITDANNVEAKLTSLTVAGVAATIDEASKTASVEVGSDADLSSLAIVAEVSAGAEVTSGTTIDASTGSAEIVVTSKVDGSVTSTYTVTVTKSEEPATGVEETENEVVNTYYISVDGRIYNSIVKGLPLIKVEVLSNGSVKSSKVFAEE